MGRWPYSNRSTTSEPNSISVKFLNKYHYFDGGTRQGGCSWRCHGESAGSIGFVVSTLEGEGYIRFQYTQTDKRTAEKTELDYQTRLASTPCHFGGRRWWFLCPLEVNGGACNRRVGVLYLGGGKYFGCRNCYNLTYESSKENHKFDSMWRKMGVDPKIGRNVLKKGW